MAKAEPKDTRPDNELYLIALILKVGGHNITDANVEQARTHTLTTERDPQTNEIVLAAIPTVAKG